MKHRQIVLMVLLALSLPALAAPLAERAGDFKVPLAEKILPYWFDTAQDAAKRKISE